ncbi:MAG TPA: hypothetical protein VGE20_01630 [Ramlibacter sp.]
MQQFARGVFAAVSTAFLVACGGGDTVGDPPLAYRAGALQASPERQAPQRAARAVDATALMDWAEGAYSQFFPSHEADRTLGPFVYRAYPNDVYLAVGGGMVYVMGGPFGGVAIEVAPVAVFACFVYPENCPVISGVAAKGLLKGATVGVYNMNGDGSRGGLLASAITGEDGRFSVTLPAPPDGPVLVEASGGTYTSGYDGASVASQTTISTMLPTVSATGESGVSVNPLTDMAASLARTYLTRGDELAPAVQMAENWVAWQYGLASRPSRIVPAFDVTAVTNNPEGVQLALVLAALDTLGSRLSAANPDAIFGALSADFSDAVFDGWAMSGQRVTVNGSALPTGAGNTEFMKAFAVSFSGTSSGLRPAYLDAHFNRSTIVENYQAEIIPVYVAQEVAAYFPARYTSPLPNTTRMDATVAGCPAGAPLAEQNGTLTCGAFYSCGTATLVIVNGRESCSDGSIAVFHSATIAPYTAQSIAPFTAQTAETYQAQTAIAQPAAGTPAIFRASAVHLLTAEELAAMAAADHAIGSAYAAKYSSLGMPTSLQLEWMGRINDAVMASVRY